MDDKIGLLKENKVFQVLSELKPHIEEEGTSENDAPVRACYRYIKNRTHQFDYKTALEKELPIGSGEIEGAHRNVIQKRLKISGAWWIDVNAEVMLHLRTTRANDDWENHWRNAA